MKIDIDFIKRVILSLLWISRNYLRFIYVLNKQFHTAIYKVAGSPVLMSIIENLWLRYAPWVTLYLHISLVEASKASLARSIKEKKSSHRRIIRALKAGDPEKSRVYGALGKEYAAEFKTKYGKARG